MRGRHRFAILCAIAFALIAAAPAPGVEIGFRIVGTGTGTVTDSTVASGPVARVVHDGKAARALLSAWSMEKAPRLLTTVDFRRRSLVVVLGGWMPSPGFVLLPGAVTERDGAVAFTGTVFRRGGGSATVLAQPWAMVSVPREAVATVAPDVAVTLRCGPRVRCRPHVS